MRRKLTDEQAAEIRAARADVPERGKGRGLGRRDPRSYKMLARKYGVCIHTIHGIVKGLRYREALDENALDSDPPSATE